MEHPHQEQEQCSALGTLGLFSIALGFVAGWLFLAVKVIKWFWYL